MGRNADVVRSFFDAFASGEIEVARDLVSDEFSFRGPMLQTDGKEAFFEGSAGLGPMVRGINLLQQWEDGDDVCSIYEFGLETPAGSGDVLMSEWHTVRDGKLASSRLIFNTAEFEALMPAEE